MAMTANHGFDVYNTNTTPTMPEPYPQSPELASLIYFIFLNISMSNLSLGDKNIFWYDKWENIFIFFMATYSYIHCNSSTFQVFIIKLQNMIACYIIT